MKNFTKNKKNVLLLVIGIILTLSLILGTTYAFFSATANNDSKQSVINTGIMELEFTDGEYVSANNMMPGQSITKTFKVKNTGTVATRYDAYLSEVINTFVTKSDLVYSLTTDDENYNKTNIEVPSEPTKIVNQRNIEPNQIQEYTLVLTFRETGVNQDINKEKKFSAKIAINEFKYAQIEDNNIKYWNDNYLSNFYAQDEVPDEEYLYSDYRQLILTYMQTHQENIESLNVRNFPFVRTTYENNAPVSHDSCMYYSTLDKKICIEFDYWYSIVGSRQASLANAELVKTALKSAMDQELGVETECSVDSESASCTYDNASCVANNDGSISCLGTSYFDCYIYNDGYTYCSYN